MPAAMFLNLAAYKFVSLSNLPELRGSIRDKARHYGLKGTVLLSPEGINLFVAGEVEQAQAWLAWLRQNPEFADLEAKESLSDEQPFNRMLVRLKREIIAFGIDGIAPATETSPKLDAHTLKSWLDEGRDITLLDVRNDYEVDVGTFEGAKAIGIDHFRHFPAAVAELPANLKDKPVVMFCTGGIRCEKAGPFMEHAGFREIYQLDGGILKYFELVGGAHYRGDCFVFDKRVAVQPNLAAADVIQCFACQAVLTKEDQQSAAYVFGKSCPHCYVSPEQQMLNELAAKQQKLAELTSPLPGSSPADNLRPINIPLRCDRRPLIDCLCELFPHYTRASWEEQFAQQRVLVAAEDRVLQRPADPLKIVRSGEQFRHLFPATIEPPVSADIRLLWEDDAILVVEKPAPLPVHPCGRFERNTLVEILNLLYAPQKVRPVHRLDANTTGLLVLAKSRRIASIVQPQFESGSVKKTYLAVVIGSPTEEQFTLHGKIAVAEETAGVRIVADDGLAAETRVKVRERRGNGTTVLEVQPISGRTNQIRAHLWDAGLPIVGDPIYLPEKQLGQTQTLEMEQPPMLLHAWRISLQHPVTQQWLSWESPPAASFN